MKPTCPATEEHGRAVSTDEETEQELNRKLINFRAGQWEDTAT